MAARVCAGKTNASATKSTAAIAVAQGRADWGVAIRPVAAQYGLGFLPLGPEHYDFVVPDDRRERPAVRRFVELVGDPAVRSELARLGFEP